jgi:hypothetical protein
MAACEKIYIEDETQIAEYEQWVKTAPKKTKKWLKKRTYVYLNNEDHLMAKIYMNEKITKSLSRCNLPWLKEKAIEQGEFFGLVQGIIKNIFLDNE